ITHPGACEVHERFTPADIRQIRADYAGDVTVLAHPECPPEVVDEADYAGSTAQMINFVADRRPKRVALITECSMSDNVAQEYPEVEFVRPCNMCPHMKRNTMASIRRALETMTNEVTIDADVADRARAAVERMLAVGAK
ncbi:MAG TPA: quinolinate synthase NadA, partial [Micropruina sp.]|nr:quinolinate synthase NadA [Micropruina sp.]